MAMERRRTAIVRDFAGWRERIREVEKVEGNDGGRIR